MAQIVVYINELIQKVDLFYSNNEPNDLYGKQST